MIVTVTVTLIVTMMKPNIMIDYRVKVIPKVNYLLIGFKTLCAT